ncbi:uncharacterized protein LOC111692030 [Anoplophora glabripennis]|uniref:uncharacterized protein LOC111692030 n=1 Tax=Anoplophora glabripennis TaxID=217634 RepID=UPI000C77320C|nr:uncharacterized protein LOC111692030 [Anoplophora glabripennis]
MTMIHNFCIDHPKQLERGENAYASGHVVEVRFDSDFKPAVLTGKVMASMKNKSYNVEICIDLDGGIVDATCQCPRGQVICHHMAALCIHAYHNVSFTDKACQWNIPKRAGGR